ncbi:hypothetical protein B0O79_0639 [Flavobacteriaceae bacterium MAR_2009_75]|nr:hypothetical protein B0O79_0639 [Flavobacteriaceae bacterium MAR_2009_75]
MYKFFQHVKFLLKATNQHGVHSPFVYSYLTKCLYTKHRFHKRKTLNILLKSIDYFNVERVRTNDSGAISQMITEHYPKVSIIESKTDLIFLKKPEKPLIAQILSSTNSISNDCILLIDNIYLDAEHKNIWNDLKNNNRVSVTIDMFYCGAVFFRKEQEKEHFKIRV